MKTSSEIEVAIQTDEYEVLQQSNFSNNNSLVILGKGERFKRIEEGSDNFTNGVTTISETILERNNHVFKVIWNNEKD